MSQTPPAFAEEVEEFTVCPRCELPGGYMLRIPRSKWRRLFHIKKKHYLCQECGHRFYTNASVRH